MDNQAAYHWSRRELLRGLTLAGAAGFLGLEPRPVAAEPPPETTTIRLVQSPVICFSPQFVAEELLKLEGFTDVQYVKVKRGPYNALATGQADINTGLGGRFIISVDRGDAITILAGAHVGCFELFGTEHVRSVRDLKGRTVRVPGLGSSHHIFVGMMAAYVGLDPRKDITFVSPPMDEAMRLLDEGKIDAIMGFPPEPQELRAKKIGRVVVDTTVDRPWSRYFCCMLAGNRQFVQRHPIATKRALRAIMKANQVCALEPDRAARLLVDKGYAKNYDYAFQSVQELPYAKWREFNPEDTVRFQALRLQEAGMIGSTPKRIIAQGTDWRFINQLKQELKG